VQRHKVEFPPTCVLMVLEFDTQCQTVQKQDFLRIATSNHPTAPVGSDNPAILEFSGPRTNWPSRCKLVAGCTLDVEFQSASDLREVKGVRDRWGFRVVVRGYAAPQSTSSNNLSWLWQCDQLLSHVLAQIAFASVVGRPVSEQERVCHELLSSPLFVRGLSPAYLVSERDSELTVLKPSRHVSGVKSGESRARVLPPHTP
jgi:hypothetical protein